MSPEPSKIVRAGYDQVADDYATWVRGVRGAPRGEWLDELLGRLEAGSDVLELGIGGGVASSRRIAESHRLTGVDLSRAQLARARERLPEATLVRADMAKIAFPQGSFDAAVSFFALMHVPRGQVPALLKRICGWLRPGGWLLATFETRDNPGEVADWIGTPMFTASSPAVETVAALTAAGFRLERAELVAQDEPGQPQPVEYLWALAQKA